jgi:hypothetical protein
MNRLPFTSTVAIAVTAACFSLAGCGSMPREPAVRVVETKVPVAVACVPEKLPTQPSYPDTDAALQSAPGAGDMLQLLAAGRLLRIQRLSEIEPVIAGCR